MLDSLFGMRGKTVLITGGAGLLGMMHGEAILMAGGTPVLADIDEAALRKAAATIEAKLHVAPKTLRIDVTDEASIQAARAELRKAGTSVDVLVNNAARNPKVSGDVGLKTSNRLEALDLAAFNLDMNVGLTGAVLCAKVFGADMAERGHGVIVNVSSDLGVIAPDQRLYKVDGKAEGEQDVKPVSYSVVKHGLLGLTKYLATYWAHRGVRCNAISPGGVYNGQNEIFLSKLKPLIPVGRMAHPNEYQGALIFLCSEASSYMNGANLIMDGGRSVW